MLRKTKISRFLSLAVIIALVFMSIPGEGVWAAEDGRDTFVITSFEEQDGWPLITSTFPVGTAVSDMKFPTEWTVKGYLKMDPDKTITEKILTQLVWPGVPAEDEVQKSENGTKDESGKYKPESGAGTYLFRLELPEGFETEDAVKLPEQKVIIGDDQKVTDQPSSTSGTKSAGSDPSNAKSTEGKPADNNLTDSNAADTKPSDSNAADTKPSDSNAADTKPADTNPADSNTADTKPSDSNAADTKPSDTNPADSNTAETKPADSNTTDTNIKNGNTAGSNPVNTKSTGNGDATQPDPQSGTPRDAGNVVLQAEDLPGRMIVGKKYQIEAEAQGTTPPPSITYAVLTGADVVTVDSSGLIDVLKAGSFSIQINCGGQSKELSGTSVQPDTDSKIHSFAIKEWSGVITEDPQGSLINVTVPYGTDLTSLAPAIGIGIYAQVSPASGEARNFSDPVVYTVTAEDGTNTVYTVKVEAVCTEHQWIPATCTQPGICGICGVKGAEATGHQWKEATCTEPKTCTVCGTKEGNALGHQWKEATCTEPKTCTVCGAKEGEALGHQWEAADCTHAETCSRCGLTRGTALGHSWGDWKVKKQPTMKEKGLEERICSRCQLTQTREIPRLNIIGKAENNRIQGIKVKGIYGVNEKITITAYGDGMDNQEPIANDVRYVPSGWHVTSYNPWTKAPYQSTFTVKAAGNYQLQVYFQKQTYDGKNWINNKEVDTKTVDFTISVNKAIPVKTGDDAPLGALAAAMGLAALVMAVDLGWKRKKAKE